MIDFVIERLPTASAGQTIVMTALLCLLASWLPGSELAPGLHYRTLIVDGRVRSYWVQVPRGVDADTEKPLVLVLHGAGVNALFMMPFTGWNQTSQTTGAVVVYPNGTGFGPFLTWNAGSFEEGSGAVDDVKFLSTVIDQVQSRVTIDPRRVYATGFSGGGFMCYRLAAELPQRIAAIAPVAGSLTVDVAELSRPVPAIHFHGLADAIVPYDGPNESIPSFLTFRSVADTIEAWRQLCGCPETPVMTQFPDLADDGTLVRRFRYGPGTDGAEVELIQIERGGHTWPGRRPLLGFLGLSTRDISANELMWEFFLRHPLPEGP